MFAKLERGKLVCAPKYYQIDGMAVFTNNPKIHLSQGYKEVTRTPSPETDENHYAISSWIDDGEKVVQVWEVREYEPDE